MIVTPVCIECVYLPAPYLRYLEILKYNIFLPNTCLPLRPSVLK